MGDLLLPMATLAILDDPLADWDWAFFPLMFLPVEILFKIMQCLTVSDRLRARVCRKLRDIENKDEYKLENLHISTPNFGPWVDCDRMLLEKSSKSYLDGLCKIAKNNLFSNIVFQINNTYGEIFDFVSTMTATSIYISIKDIGLSTELLTVEAIEKILKVEGRKSVTFYETVPALTSSLLQKLYRDLLSGEVKPQVNFYTVVHTVARSFLATLGLHVDTDGDFITTNEHLRVFYWIGDTYLVAIESMLIYVNTPIYEKCEPGHVFLGNYLTEDRVNRVIKNMDDDLELKEMDVYYEEDFDEEGNEENMVPSSELTKRLMVYRRQERDKDNHDE